MMNKINKNNQNNQSNIPSDGGFSEIRIRFIVLLGALSILIMAPIFGFILSSLLIVLIGIYVILNTVKAQENDAEYQYQHMLSMDRLYNNGRFQKDILEKREIYFMFNPKMQPAADKKAKGAIV